MADEDWIGPRLIDSTSRLLPGRGGVQHREAHLEIGEVRTDDGGVSWLP